MSNDAQQAIADLKEQIGMLTAQVHQALEVGKRHEQDIEALQKDILSQQQLSKTLGDRLFLGVDDHGVPITLVQKFQEVIYEINSLKEHDDRKCEELMKARQKSFSWMNFAKGIATIGVIVGIAMTTAWQIISGGSTGEDMIEEMPKNLPDKK